MLLTYLSLPIYLTNGFSTVAVFGLEWIKQGSVHSVLNLDDILHRISATLYLLWIHKVGSLNSDLFVTKNLTIV